MSCTTPMVPPTSLAAALNAAATSPSNANKADAESLAHRLETWAPEGPLVPAPGASCPEAVLGMGVVQNYTYLLKAWHGYLEGGEESPAMIDAFALAAALCLRRCPQAIHPMVGQLIEHATTYTPDTALRLAYMAADVGNAELGYKLLAKTRDMQTLPSAFFLALLRLSTESVTPPDINLALDVTERMQEAGKPHTTLSLKLLFLGLSRMPAPPIRTALRVMDYRRHGKPDAPLDACLLNAFYQVLDTAVGPEAKLAADYIKSLPEAQVNAPIAPTCKEAPSLNHAGCFESDCTTYMVVDACTADLSGAFSIPPNTYLVFLYSTVRTMELRASTVCHTNPVVRKLADLKTLFASNKQAVVVPYETELRCRATLGAKNDRPITPQDRLLLFTRITKASESASFKIQLLSADPIVIKGAKQMDVPVFTNLSGGRAMSPSASTTDAALANQRLAMANVGPCGM